MSGCYVVLSTNDGAEVEVCETYAGVQAALGRAMHLAAKKAKDITYVDTSPEEEKLEDGVRWVFLNTSKHFVGVYFKHINSTFGARNTRLDAVKSVPVVVSFADGYQSPVKQLSIGELIKQKLGLSATAQGIVNSLPPDDAYADELPGGWNVDGEPIRMKYYKDSAEDTKNPCSELTEDEKWALAIARVSKRPAFVATVGLHSYLYDTVLQHLKARNVLGLHIRDKEMQLLGVYRAKVIDSYYK